MTMQRVTIVGGAGLLLGGLLMVHWNGHQTAIRRASDRARVEAEVPRLERGSNYVSSATCQACHPKAYATWHRTYHRTMTQVATPETVLGEFDGTTVSSDGLDYRVFRQGDTFWAEMPDPDVMMYVVQGGRKLRWDEIPRVTRPVVMTTGSHHYQTYWVASERYDRLLQTLPLVYLKADRRWIPREEAFMRGPQDRERFVTQWNHHCIRCHSTGGNPGLDEATGMLRTEVGELGIACEACHGPAEAHVARHRNPWARLAARGAPGTDPTIVNPARLDPRRSSEACGQCHGVYIYKEEHAMDFARHGSSYRPGEDLERTRYYIQHPRADPNPERWEELARNPDFFRQCWWDDGTVLAGGREYTGMSATACFQRGTLSCLSCHSMHDSDPADQLKPGMETGRACTSCHHEPQYTEDVTRHTFHPAGSSGSDCLNCHMPHTTYALLNAIRTHQIGVPRVRPSVEFGVPNACNLCHLDRTLSWTGEQLTRWYGQAPVPMTDEQRSVAAALVWLLKGHAAQRVIAAWHVGWAPAWEASGGAEWLAPFQAQLLADPYGVVRYVAGRRLRQLPGFAAFEDDFLAPEATRQQRVEEARERWQARRPPGGRTGSEILIDEEGRWQSDRVATMVAERDERPVTILE